MKVALVLLAVAWSAVRAQPTDPSFTDVERFTALARHATARFKDLDVAVAESYVKVGPDFPAMGEHWVNGELIMRGELDPARPAILTYTTVAGRPTLTGVVYALALKRGEAPPLLPRGAAWHDHVGSIDEESLLFGHEHHADDDIRLVVMHAWIWQDNPDGTFATDNWALPYARLGLHPPSVATGQAARAVALLSGAATYFGQLFARGAALDERTTARVNDVLERHRSALSRWWTARATAADLTLDELRELHERWTRLAEDVRSVLPREARQRLEAMLVPSRVPARH